MMRTPRDAGYLRDLFSRNARTYDPVNNLISLGQVNRWRADLVRLMGIGPRDRVLDAFSGPGSLGLLALRRLGGEGHLVLADVSPLMLAEARRRLQSDPRRSANGRGRPRVDFRVTDLVQAQLHVAPGEKAAALVAALSPGGSPVQFDCVLVGFGLRYVPDPALTLPTLGLLLRPGGRVGILEFTVPENRGFSRAIWALPRVYFSRVLPALAGHLAGDREIYEYLRASSEGFLTPATLLECVRSSGFQPLLSATRMGGLVSIIVATPILREKALSRAQTRRTST